jgi:antitoxin ParD1/3/4
MNITLNRELEEWIQERVDGDLYQSASEVIEDAVLLLQEHSALQQARLRRLRKKLNVGIEQLDRGERIPGSKDFLENVKRKGRVKLEQAV